MNFNGKSSVQIWSRYQREQVFFIIQLRRKIATSTAFLKIESY